MNADDVIANRLKHLAECLDELRSFSVHARSFEAYRANRMLRRAVERTLQVAIETCLDIGSHLISAEGFRYPETNREVFAILHEEGVLTDQATECLLQMAAFRNILVHEYVRVSDPIVYRVLKERLGDLEGFAHEVVLWIERGG
ncbi:MAG: DUF86 domain-containing protein [Anaerolineae bacterium]|nr:DUF86 domain-containing protein [Anaerolineae bacterium]